ncbi:MAG TPA: class I SAM-dependent methyltransferase, partial [Chitinophagaceae bacterium]|nr:class I SAM-dependent methyltransferase [Chitinophagaceae bacterium]
MNITQLISCPLCNSDKTILWSVAKDYEYASTNDEYKYYYCKNCISLFISPVPENELHRIYPSNYYSFQPGKKNWAFLIKEWLDKKLFKKILNQLKNDNINVLDIGGGTGWLCDLVKTIDKRTALTQVVDIDSDAKKIAEEKGHRYFEGRIEEFTRSEKFDLVFLLNLLEHVAHPIDVLQQIEQLLNPGGIVLIKTPNILSLDARLFRKKYWGGLHCPRHWIIFSENSFRNMLTSTRLKITDLHYTQGGPFWAFSIIVWLS